MVRGGRDEDVAVNDVSLEAGFGEMLYIVGPSGSGKTTLLSMISGILRPNAGTVQRRRTRTCGRSRTTGSPTSA